MNCCDLKIPKILLVGKHKVGKTSMRSIIFAKMRPRDTHHLGYTQGISESRFRFMDKTMLDLIDCGGQDEFMDQLFDEIRKPQIFTNVGMFIYVFEADNSKTTYGNQDLLSYKKCIEALSLYSKEAKVFVLLHKMDMVREDKRASLYESRVKDIFDRSGDFDIKCFGTSIWDASLYRAWTEIVGTLIMDMDSIKAALAKFSESNSVEEVVLFEKSTFLPICDYSTNEGIDNDKIRDISYIINKFKLSVQEAPLKAPFQSILVKNKTGTTLLEDFTKGTFIMVKVKGNTVNPELLVLNINLSKKYFESILTT
jgi:Ras-related GTP-binding protein A/B